jgi:hypothetical protein
MWICCRMFLVGTVLALALIRDRGAAPPDTCTGPVALCGDPVLAAALGDPGSAQAY